MSPRSHPDLLLGLGPDPDPDPAPADTPHSQGASTMGDHGGPAETSGTDVEAEEPSPPSHTSLPSGRSWVGHVAARFISSHPISSPGSAPPAASRPTPPRSADLWARAPRPVAVRLRRTLAVGAALGAASILAGSLAWAFVVRPEMRAVATVRQEPQNPDERQARPPRSLSERPGRYDQLPQPRTWPAGLQDGGPDASLSAGPDAASLAPSPTAASTSAPHGGSQYRPRHQSDEGGPQVRPHTEYSPTRLRPEPTLEVRAHGSQLFFAGADEPQGIGRPGASPGSDQRLGAPAAHGTGPSVGRDIYNPARLTRPLSPYEVKAGSVIPAALLTAVDTGRRGPAAAVVTRSIHDTVSGRHLLVPQGSRLIGRYDGDSAYGDRKAFIVWERLLLPDGRSLALDDEPGVDAAGALGSQGRVDRRLLPLALAVLSGGAVTAIGEAARDSDGGGGLLGDAGDAAALEAARTGARLIDRELQVRPVIRLAPGAPVGVLVTRDLVLEPWRP